MPGGGRFFKGGGQIVVWDDVPPLVKVFQRNGVPTASFLPRGNGPGEAREVSAVAVVEDSLLMIATGARRLSVVRADGHFLTEHELQRPISLAALCDGAPAVYTPRPREGGGTDWVFLASRAEGDGISLTPIFGDTVSAEGIAIRSPGLVPREGGLLLRHAFGGSVSLVEFDCAGEVTGVVEVPRAAVARRATRDAEGGTMAVAVQSGSTLQAGLGSAGEYAILADLVVGQRDDAETDLRTVLHIVKNGVVLEEVRIRGNYSILDSRPGVGLLVTSYDPFPHVFVVPEEELLQVLRRRW